MTGLVVIHIYGGTKFKNRYRSGTGRSRADSGLKVEFRNALGQDADSLSRNIKGIQDWKL